LGGTHGCGHTEMSRVRRFNALLVPLYGFLEGDTLGLVVLVHDDERIRAIAEQLQLAACVRVAPRAHAQVYFRGQRLDPELTVSESGLASLDRVDVVPEEKE
jgi:Toluene-4-monooxygenase system protein B (TmoB)